MYTKYLFFISALDDFVVDLSFSLSPNIKHIPILLKFQKCILVQPQKTDKDQNQNWIHKVVLEVKLIIQARSYKRKSTGLGQFCCVIAETLNVAVSRFIMCKLRDGLQAFNRLSPSGQKYQQL